MAEWVGALLGSVIGLMAILLGALYNASLTRKRDDKIMDDQAKTIAAAIGAEMGVHAEMLCGRMAQSLAGPDGRSPGFFQALVCPQPVVWPGLAPKIGCLDAETAAQIVKCWALLTWHAQLLQATVSDMQSGHWKLGSAMSRWEFVKADMPRIADTVQKLTGTRPDIDNPLP